MNDRAAGSPIESQAENPGLEFQVGGSLPLDAVSYVRRQADGLFDQELKAGNYCYVLNSRQMGKSSLRVRTSAKLREDGIVSVEIDMAEIGQKDVTADQLYLGLLWQIVKAMKSQTGAFQDWELSTVRDWWQSQEGLSLVQRWSEFLQGVLLERVVQPIVIFIDEIDSVMGLPFPADDFFASIRACHERRASDARFSRLTFAFLGVCAPQDLIQDVNRTPFNVGKAIELAGFQFEEMAPLQAVLGVGQEVIAEVLGWTGGQPFLTQKLCKLLQQSRLVGADGSGADAGSADWVARVVRDGIVENWQGKDDPVHLRTIQGKVLAEKEGEAGRLLGIYQGILAQADGIEGDDSPEQMQLRLSGLVVKRNGRLRAFNQIYREVFDGAWVATELAKLRPDFYRAAIAAWLKSGDESVLLRGDALRDGLEWAQGKQLSDEDSRFLRQSQEAENRSEKEANQILTVATTKAKKRLVWSTTVAIAALAIAGIAAFEADKSNGKAQIAKAEEQTAKGEAQTAKGEAQTAKGEAQTAKGEVWKVRQQYDAAQQQVAQATQQLVQVNQDREAATQAKVEAQTQSAEAQRQLGVAITDKNQADEEKTIAHQSAKEAKKQRDIVQQGTMLEREVAALLSLPDDEYYNIQTKLFTTLEIANKTKKLLAKIGIPKNLNDYPAKTPLLALRLKVNEIKHQNKHRKFITSNTNGNQKILLYDLQGKQLTELQGNKIQLDLDDGKILAVGENEIYLYDWIGKEVEKFTGKNAKFSPDGKKFIVSGLNYTSLYNNPNGFPWVPYLLLGKNARFSSNSNQVVVMNDVGHIFVSDVSGKIIFERSEDNPPVPRLCGGPRYEIRGINSILISPDVPGTYWECDLDLVDQKLADFTDGSYPTFISNNGSNIIVGGFKGIWLDNLATGQRVEFQGNYGRFSFDGKQILTVEDSGNLLDRTKVRRYSLSGEKLAEFSDENRIMYPRFSPNGQVIIATILFSDKDISRLYDLTGKKVRDFPGIAPIFSPDGRTILTTFQGEDMTRLYDLEGNLLAEYLGSTLPRDRNYRSLPLGFTKDGTQILTLAVDGTFRVWDIDANLATDGGLTDLINRGCAKLKNFRHREDVRKVCPEN
jgi:WD40 repeat protein